MIILVAGAGAGLLLAQILVQELQGAFDPPPEQRAVPWIYLAAIGLAGRFRYGSAHENGLRQAQIEPVVRMRQLQ